MLGSTELESTSSSAAAALLPPPPRFDPETLRIPLTAMGLGFVSGVFSSASRASMVFMAENAHRQPDTVQGWYFYNKTKNYKVILAGVKGGFKSGLRLGAWAVSWVALDHGIAACRRSVLFGPSPTQPPLIISLSPEPSVQLSPPATTDLAGSDVASDEGSAVLYHPHDRYMRWFDGALAGTGVASGAVLLHRLPRPTSFHFILGGLLAGGVFGGLRDLQGLIAEAKPESEASKHTSSPVVVPSPAATPINR
ncbi:hypothetical protein OC846_001925 [Tilletia horrida]|uniref:Uncharacterized protein n=1 Tax=Tilletia horrida TaxID=155126 RepID=A0AAN6JSK7_9BASI|nr:hypothetical protein OC845_002020 [Tilletia horrida]KAK0554822.1 hypothetical protein OC846_001925 [Tilletia horrida]